MGNSVALRLLLPTMPLPPPPPAAAHLGDHLAAPLPGAGGAPDGGHTAIGIDSDRFKAAKAGNARAGCNAISVRESAPESLNAHGLLHGELELQADDPCKRGGRSRCLGCFEHVQPGSSSIWDPGGVRLILSVVSVRW